MEDQRESLRMDNSNKFEKHEGKEQIDNENSDEEDTSFCKPCAMSFDTAEKYYCHTRGLMHIQRLVLHDLENSGTSEQNLNSSSQKQHSPLTSQQAGQVQEDGKENATKPLLSSVQENVSLVANQGLKLTKSSDCGDEDLKGYETFEDQMINREGILNYRCKLCDIKTNGLKDMRSHINGKNHKLVQVAVKKQLPLPLRVQRRLGPNSQAHHLYSECSNDNAQGSDSSVLLDVLRSVSQGIIGLQAIKEYQLPNEVNFKCTICDAQCSLSSIKPHLLSNDHRMNYLKANHPITYNHVQAHGGKHAQLYFFLEEICCDIEAKEGRGVPLIVKTEDKQAQAAANSVLLLFPEFDKSMSSPASSPHIQATLVLRISLLDELSKRGISPDLAREIVEARLKLLEEYGKRGVPFDIAKERVIHEEERWSLLVDFERQSLSFEEAEQRIDRRLQVLNLYKKKGMQQEDAVQKIIEEELIPDFTSDFMKLGHTHYKAQEFAKRRLLLLGEYHRQGFPSEVASRKVIAEELQWRGFGSTLSGQKETTSKHHEVLAMGISDSPITKQETATETEINQTAEEAIAHRIGKLLEKLFPQSVGDGRAKLQEDIQEYEKTAKQGSDGSQAKDLNVMSEACKEQLQEKFDRNCREEIQKLFAHLLEQRIPTEEAKARLQNLKTEHENIRQAFFSVGCIQQDPWKQDTDSGECFGSSCENDNIGVTHRKYCKSPSTFRKRSSESPTRRMQSDDRYQSKDFKKLKSNFTELHDVTNSLDLLESFQQLLESSVTSSNRCKPLHSEEPFHKRICEDHYHQIRSVSSYTPHSISFPNRSRSSKSSTSSSSAQSRILLRRSRQRSSSLLRVSNSMHRSRIRSPFRSDHSDERYNQQSSLRNSRLSKFSTRQSRSASSWRAQHQDDSFFDRMRHHLKRNSHKSSSPERHSLQGCKHRTRSPLSISSSSQSFRERYRERRDSRERKPMPRHHSVSSPPLADSSPNRRRNDRDNSLYRRWMDSCPYRRKNRSPYRRERDRSPYRRERDSSPYKSDRDSAPYKSDRDGFSYGRARCSSPYRRHISSISEAAPKKA